MYSKLIVNSNERETRAVILENDVPVEIFIERKDNVHTVGNIYKGVVTKVLPGMQAAFVDIGLDKAGFLYVSDIDILDMIDEHEKIFINNKQEEDDHDDSNEDKDSEEEDDDIDKVRRNMIKRSFAIEEILREGQEILVQITKDPLGTKGARLTSYISLPGRYLVFMPTVDHTAVSRRISSDSEKKRLKKIINKIKSAGSGYIIRTAGEGKNEEEFIADVTFLARLWDDIKKKDEAASVPSLVYSDLDLVRRSLRDLDIQKIVIDSQEEYDKCIDFVNSYLCPDNYEIELFQGQEPIFEAFGLEIELNRLLGRKIWLKSGGYIIIEQTEALTAIDVNTGKYVGKTDHEQTAAKINIEAVKEIVYQIRLRNIGGLIMIDFIDMEKKENREKLYTTLENALKTDRSRTTILKVSELGIVEMARKRVRDSINRILCEPCPYCDRKGEIKSRRTICYEIFREINKLAMYMPEKKNKIYINVHPSVADMLFNEESWYISKIETVIGKEIIIKADVNMHIEHYEVSAY